MYALYWPNGRICWQVNAYLLWLRRSGLATSTVNTYGSELSNLVRYLAENESFFEDVTDDTLLSFADWLLARNKASGNHVNRLLHRAISFFIWLQNTIIGSHLVGAHGEGAQITLVTRVVRRRKGGVTTVLRHASMVPRSIPRAIRPASADVVEALLDACAHTAKTDFRQSRDRSMIVLLADAGIRREELTWIRCEHIREAARNGGRLRIRTSKRHGHPEREVPIPNVTARMLVDYLDINRAIQVRSLRNRTGVSRDAGWAFCTRMGTKMAPATVTQLFADLRGEAGISERATAHMLRHRFITLQVVARLRALNRDRAFGVEAMTTVLSKVASLSGHGNLQSLWRYVDWAYEEIQLVNNDEQLKEACQIIDHLIADLGSTLDLEVSEALSKVRKALRTSQSLNATLPSVAAHSARNADRSS